MCADLLHSEPHTTSIKIQVEVARRKTCAARSLYVCIASVRPNSVPCFDLVLPSLEPPAHTFRALERCWYAGEGLPCCPVMSCGSSGAANGRADEEYQVRARYQVRASPLLSPSFGAAHDQREYTSGDGVPEDMCRFGRWSRQQHAPRQTRDGAMSENLHNGRTFVI